MEEKKKKGPGVKYLKPCLKGYVLPSVLTPVLIVFEVALEVLIPLFILAVPVFDTFAVVMIRLLNHKPVYVGDHNHISHRFLHMGMTRKRAVLLVHLLCLIAGFGALPLLWGDERICMILLVQGLTIFLLLTIIQYSSGMNPNADQINSNPINKG